MDCVFSPSSKSKKAPAKQNDPSDDDDDDFQTPAKKDSEEMASDSEFSDWNEYDCETDASSRQVRLRLSGSDVHRTLPHWATS